MGPMHSRSDTPPHSFRHEWEHLRYHHRSSTGGTKISDGVYEIYLDCVTSLCLASPNAEFATQPPITKGRQNEAKL